MMANLEVQDCYSFDDRDNQIDERSKESEKSPPPAGIRGLRGQQPKELTLQVSCLAASTSESEEPDEVVVQQYVDLKEDTGKYELKIETLVSPRNQKEASLVAHDILKLQDTPKSNHYYDAGNYLSNQKSVDAKKFKKICFETTFDQQQGEESQTDSDLDDDVTII